MLGASDQNKQTTGGCLPGSHLPAQPGVPCGQIVEGEFRQSQPEGLFCHQDVILLLQFIFGLPFFFLHRGVELIVWIFLYPASPFQAAESLADPTKYENLFPGLKEAFAAEHYLRETCLGNTRPAAKYPLVTVSCMDYKIT